MKWLLKKSTWILPGFWLNLEQIKLQGTFMISHQLIMPIRQSYTGIPPLTRFWWQPENHVRRNSRYASQSKGEKNCQKNLHNAEILYYKIVLCKFFWQFLKDRVIQIRAMENRVSRGMHVVTFGLVNEDNGKTLVKNSLLATWSYNKKPYLIKSNTLNSIVCPQQSREFINIKKFRLNRFDIKIIKYR